MRALIAVLSVLFVAGIVTAAGTIMKTQTDTLQHGRASSTDNKEVIFDRGDGSANPRLRVPDAGNMQFSNDGVTFQEVGFTGNAYNVEMVTNRDAEVGTATWTNTGTGTFVRTTTAANVGNGTGSFEFDAAAASDVVASDLKAIPRILYSQPCEVSLRYKDGDGNLALEVYDGAVVISSVPFVTSATFRTLLARFACPSTGSLRVRVFATANAAVVRFDEVHLGTDSGFLEPGALTVDTVRGDLHIPVGHTMFYPTLDIPSGVTVDVGGKLIVVGNITGTGTMTGTGTIVSIP
jgi:hypothetical protein